MPVDERSVLWVSLCCPCGRTFVGNAHSVPVIKGEPWCRRCWDALGDLRERYGVARWLTPPRAYPDDTPLL